MSDDLGTDAGTGAPNVAPEPEVEEQQVDGAGRPIEKTSVEAKAPATKKTPETEPKKKERTPDDDLEDLLKKTGGLKYKAGGKEKTAASLADLKRLLSSRDSEGTAIEQAAKDKREAMELKSTLSSIAKLPPRDRLGAMQAAGIDPKLIREAVEESILAEDEQAKSQAHLSPREREYEAKLREREAELEQFREQQAAAQREKEEAEYVQRVTQTGERLTKTAVGALQKAKIAGEHAPRFLQAIADRLDRNERLGLELDEGEIADVVMKEHETMADQYYSALDVPALADKLEGMAIPDPDDATKQTTRLKLLMRECARRIRSKVNGSFPSPLPVRVAKTEDKRQTMAELMDAARTFGGGAR